MAPAPPARWLVLAAAALLPGGRAFTACEREPGDCPVDWPSSPQPNYRACRRPGTVCPSEEIDELTSFGDQLGFSVETWPNLLAQDGQQLKITCHVDLTKVPHQHVCTTATAGYLADRILGCTPGEQAVHAAVAGDSTVSQNLVKRGDNPGDFWLPVDAGGLMAGRRYKVCIDQDGTFRGAAGKPFKEIGVLVPLVAP